MPKINVEHSSDLSPADAFDKLKTFFQNDADIRRLDPKLQCTFQDTSMTGQATGSQFKADLSVKEKSAGSIVAVIVDLPFILTPLKGKIQDTIQRKLAKHLG
jgi:hypothetical protein